MSSTKTQIEWTDTTWSPIRGCSRVSQGCMNCYAEVQAKRIQMMDRGRGVPEGEGAYDGLLAKGGQWNGKIKTVPSALSEPLRWTKPRMIFVNSMSDLFHDNVPEAFIDQIFAVMALTRRHTFQILTKRPERMQEYCQNFSFRRMVENCRGTDGVSVIERNTMQALEHQFGFYGENTFKNFERRDTWPLPNVWLGVSVEDQLTADERIPLLLQTPAAVRWISAEPLLGAIELPLKYCINCMAFTKTIEVNNSKDWGCAACKVTKGSYKGAAYTPTGVSGLDWVVGGGESGANARPMHPDWARSLRDQCASAGIPFLFKQWGEWFPMGQTLPNGSISYLDKHERIGLWDESTLSARLGRKRSGRLLDGVQHDGYPVVGG